MDNGDSDPRRTILYLMSGGFLTVAFGVLGAAAAEAAPRPIPDGGAGGSVSAGVGKALNQAVSSVGDRVVTAASAAKPASNHQPVVPAERSGKSSAGGGPVGRAPVHESSGAISARKVTANESYGQKHESSARKYELSDRGSGKNDDSDKGRRVEVRKASAVGGGGRVGGTDDAHAETRSAPAAESGTGSQRTSADRLHRSAHSRAGTDIGAGVGIGATGAGEVRGSDHKTPGRVRPPADPRTDDGAGDGVGAAGAIDGSVSPLAGRTAFGGHDVFRAHVGRVPSGHLVRTDRRVETRGGSEAGSLADLGARVSRVIGRAAGSADTAVRPTRATGPGGRGVNRVRLGRVSTGGDREILGRGDPLGTVGAGITRVAAETAGAAARPGRIVASATPAGTAGARRSGTVPANGAGPVRAQGARFLRTVAPIAAGVVRRSAAPVARTSSAAARPLAWSSRTDKPRPQGSGGLCLSGDITGVLKNGGGSGGGDACLQFDGRGVGWSLTGRAGIGGPPGVSGTVGATGSTADIDGLAGPSVGGSATVPVGPRVGVTGSGSVTHDGSNYSGSLGVTVGLGEAGKAAAVTTGDTVSGRLVDYQDIFGPGLAAAAEHPGTFLAGMGRP